MSMHQPGHQSKVDSPRVVVFFTELDACPRLKFGWIMLGIKVH
jgi:hypothetical protein